MSNIPSAKLVLLKDLNQYHQGDSVRVTGAWSSYNESTHIGLLQYNDSQVEIDITQTQNSLPREGEIIQCIGEIIGEPTNDSMARIQARVIRSVNTIDMELYEKVVQFRNTVI